MAWSLANITDEQRSDGEFTNSAAALFRHYRERHVGAPRIGSGLIIDVHTNGNGLRFASGSEGGMDDSTDILAATGVVLMAEGWVNRTGVFAPEVLKPKDFFEVLRRVSTGGGGLTLHRLEAGKSTERLRIRDLISCPPADASLQSWATLHSLTVSMPSRGQGCHVRVGSCR